jgi:pimeloyl-ACP methyl ester carboxylesterase
MQRERSLWLIHALGDSSACFEALLSSDLRLEFDLWAPDWSQPETAPPSQRGASLDALADWLARTIDSSTPAGPVGLVGHSLGTAIAVRAVSRVDRVVGLFSIEGNLTAADAYFSGLAASFDHPLHFRDALLDRVRALAEAAPAEQRDALWRYHAAVRGTAPEVVWTVGRSAHAASAGDGLGQEYRALAVPTLYYWSPDSATREAQDYVRAHALHQVAFAGGHWPMIDQPARTAADIAAFFRPLFADSARKPGPQP